MPEKTKPYKAVLSGTIAAVCTFIAFWAADSGTFEPKEIGTGLLFALGASGIVGVPTYYKKNPPA